MVSVVSHDEWEAAHEAFRQKEKALTHERDRLAAERRRLPREEVTKTYTFNTSDGKKTLSNLFEGRPQLIVYSHMLKPDDPDPCAGCCMVADHVGALDHLHARNTAFTMASAAPLAQIEAFKRTMGWTFPWVEATGDFNSDFLTKPGMFGLNVFIKEGDGKVYRTYFTTHRGVESLMGVWAMLDLTPLGRQEEWEDSPEGVQQGKPYVWWRRHGEYDE